MPAAKASREACEYSGGRLGGGELAPACASTPGACNATASASTTVPTKAGRARRRRGGMPDSSKPAAPDLGEPTTWARVRDSLSRLRARVGVRARSRARTGETAVRGSAGREPRRGRVDQAACDRHAGGHLRQRVGGKPARLDDLVVV